MLPFASLATEEIPASVIIARGGMATLVSMEMGELVETAAMEGLVGTLAGMETLLLSMATVVIGVMRPDSYRTVVRTSCGSLSGFVMIDVEVTMSRRPSSKTGLRATSDM